MDGKKTYVVAAILAVLSILDGVLQILKGGGGLEELKVNVLLILASGLAVGFRHALSKLTVPLLLVASLGLGGCISENYQLIREPQVFVFYPGKQKMITLPEDAGPPTWVDVKFDQSIDSTQNPRADTDAKLNAAVTGSGAASTETEETPEEPETPDGE